MTDDTTIIPFPQPGSIIDPLTAIARDGARRMLMAALKAEADGFVARFSEDLLADGRQRVVRHSSGPERVIQTGIGPIEVRRQKVRDRATDGALGFWKAVDEVFPGTRHPRCWFHKSSNVRGKFPKSMAPAVTSDLQDIHHAETKAEPLAVLAVFTEKYGAKYAPAVT